MVHFCTSFINGHWSSYTERPLSINWLFCRTNENNGDSSLFKKAVTAVCFYTTMVTKRVKCPCTHSIRANTNKQKCMACESNFDSMCNTVQLSDNIAPKRNAQANFISNAMQFVRQMKSTRCILACKATCQYLLTLRVSIYCLLSLQSSIV